jgi:hypothetical protein
MYTQQNNAVQWPGTQGRTYPFNVYPILTAFAANQLGNYIFAKLIGNAWHAVYIGEGDIKERTECHKREEKVHQMGATHIHVMLNDNEKNRCSIESDLLVANPEAYHPRGCNVKKGG